MWTFYKEPKKAFFCHLTCKIEIDTEIDIYFSLLTEQCRKIEKRIGTTKMKIAPS